LAVKLRLRRIGKKKQPMYKVVAADARAPRDGKFLESVGLYNPLTNPHTLELKEDRVLYWLGVGAQPTDTVASLFRQKGITLKRELTKKGLSEEKINVEMENWSKLKEAKPKSKPKRSKKSEAKASEKPAEETKESTAEVTGAASEETAPQ
jgi:small subunit ribosomal protein S16